MSVCETTHWTLDCGEGHGCYLVEFSDTGELAGWGCNSDPVKGRPKPKGDGGSYLDAERPVELCTNGMTRGGLVAALDDLVEDELVVPKGGFDEVVSVCVTGTVDEILRSTGVERRRG